MNRKEAGPLYHTRCPECGDEVEIGWLPNGPSLASLTPTVGLVTTRRTAPPVDAQGMTTEPVACQCGKVRLSLHGAAHRGVLEWDTAEEPVFGTSMTHGSLRDYAR